MYDEIERRVKRIGVFEICKQLLQSTGYWRGTFMRSWLWLDFYSGEFYANNPQCRFIHKLGAILSAAYQVKMATDKLWRRTWIRMFCERWCWL